MLKFYVGHGMTVEKIHEIISLNRVKGWKSILILGHKNETELKMFFKERLL